MAVTPIPDAPVVPQYPALGSLTFNQEAYAYGTAMPGVTQRIHEIALASKANAEEAAVQVGLAADQVDLAAQQVGLAADQVQLATVQASAASVAANRAESARDRAVQAEEAVEQALIDGPVLQVNGHTGVVNLQVQDIPGLADLVRLQRVQLTTNTSLGAGELAKILDCKGEITLSVTSPATLGAGWYCYLRNTGNSDIAITPDGAEQINGQLTYTLKPGFTVLLQYDGTNFTILELKKRTYSQRLQIESTQSFVVPADTYVIRAYAVGAGGDGGAAVASTSSGAGGSGGGMAYGDIAVTPGETLSVTIASRIAKVSRGATDLLVGNPAAHSTTTAPGAVGTASKHASVTNGGTYSGGLGGAGVTAATASGGSGASSGSPLGNGVAGTTGATASIGGEGGSGFGGSGGKANSFGGGGGGTGGNGGGGGGAYGGFGGPGLPDGAPVLDPLLRDCVAPPNHLIGLGSKGVAGRPGQGGSGGGAPGGNGGFGGGGGGGTSFSGNGGFGGGGGGSGAGAPGGNGGFGGGGAGGRVANGAIYPAGTGGAAAVIMIWD